MSFEIAPVPKCKLAACSCARLGYLNTHTSLVFYSKVKVKCAHDCVFFPRVSNFAAQLPTGAQNFDVNSSKISLPLFEAHFLRALFSLFSWKLLFLGKLQAFFWKSPKNPIPCGFSRVFIVGFLINLVDGGRGHLPCIEFMKSLILGLLKDLTFSIR